MAVGRTWIPKLSSFTTTQTSPDIPTEGARSLMVVFDVTDVSAGPSLTLTIQGKDQASGKYYTLLAGAAVITAVTNRYRVSPELAASANSIAQDVLPELIRLVVTAGNSNAGVYSVGYDLTPS